MDALLAFSQKSGIYDFMHSAWGWPMIESLHFIGLSLLIGTVGLFDLCTPAPRRPWRLYHAAVGSVSSSAVV